MSRPAQSASALEQAMTASRHAEKAKLASHRSSRVVVMPGHRCLWRSGPVNPPGCIIPARCSWTLLTLRGRKPIGARASGPVFFARGSWPACGGTADLRTHPIPRGARVGRSRYPVAGGSKSCSHWRAKYRKDLINKPGKCPACKGTRIPNPHIGLERTDK